MREKRVHIHRWILPFLALMVLFLFPASGRAAVLTGLETRNVTVYSCAKKTVQVFSDSEGRQKSETVPAAGLMITLSQEENGYYYGSYVTAGKKHTGWFQPQAFLAKPKYIAKTETIRHKVVIYRTKGGRKWLTSREYVPVKVIGKSGSWYQMLFSWGKADRIGWVRASDVRIGGNVIEYDGTPKQIISDGTYTMRPASALNRYTSAAVSSLTLSDKNGKAARFILQCDTPDRYRIRSVSTGGYLTERDGGAVLAEQGNSSEQLWTLNRNGAYYTVRSASGRYLCAGQTFTLSSQVSASCRFRLTMRGKNREHWKVFSQFDPEWGGKLYGRTNTIAGSACGVLSSVNAVYALNGQFMDPVIVADYAVKKHYRVEGSGTMYTFVAAAARHFGPAYGYRYSGATLSLSRLQKHLKSGGTAVGYVPGHYIAIADYQNGKYLVLDSYAMPKRKTTAFGTWVRPSRFHSGTLKAKNFFLLKAIK